MMICKSCGQEFGTGQTCAFCGAAQTDAVLTVSGTTEEVSPAPGGAVPAVPGSKTIFPVITLLVCLAGIVIGIVFLAGGFSGSFYWSGEIGKDAAFGGDFYTEIHERSVELTQNTSRIMKNAYSIGELLERGIGLGFILGSLMRLASAFEGYLKERKAAK